MLFYTAITDRPDLPIGTLMSINEEYSIVLHTAITNNEIKNIWRRKGDSNPCGL